MNKRFLSVVGVAAAVLAITVLRHVSLASQIELVQSLLTVAAIVFGILGVWVSVLNPAAALDQEFNEPASDSTRLAMKFAPLLRQATILLAVAVALRFALPLVPEPPESVAGQIARGCVGFVVAFLYLWQVGILIGTLLPIERATSALELAASRRRWRRDTGKEEARSTEKVPTGRSPK